MKYRTIIVMVIALAVVLWCSSTTLAAPQGMSDAVAATYETSASVLTNIHGVRTFQAPPEGFNPLAASDIDLAIYGFPPRPDAQGDPDGHAKWARAMAAAKKRWNGELKDMGAYSMPAKFAQAPAGAAPATEGTSAVPITTSSSNWSGIANTKSLTTWNKSSSFYYVISEFNVPVVQQPFGSCDQGTDWEVTWNGIDGFSNGDVLQGGSSSQATCFTFFGINFPSTSYCGWVEWYPSYPILCEFSVNPGDDFYVDTWSPNGGFNNGFVFIEDETTLTYGTFSLSYITGPPLVGKSAEYIVERPCCRGSNNYPLANYVWDFWANSYANDFYHYTHSLPTPYYPGSTATSTYLINMMDDGFTQEISVPAAQGKYGVFFYDTNCAYSGGCVP